MGSIEGLAAAERRDFADFLDTLTPQEWSGPTLCTEWSVHQLVAHVVSYEELGPLGLVGRFARGRFSPGRVNQVGVQDYAARSSADLVALLRRYAIPRGFTRAFGCRLALTDGLVHHQDVRRALGRLREVPADRLREALGQAVRPGPLGGRGRSAGLRLEATDVGWSHGEGPMVAGPGEAVLMAVGGRPEALSELIGKGAEVLAGRMSR